MSHVGYRSCGERCYWREVTSAPVQDPPLLNKHQLNKPALLAGRDMQILFGYLARKNENNPVAYCKAILKKKERKNTQNMVFKGTVITLSLYKISKHCLKEEQFSASKQQIPYNKKTCGNPEGRAVLVLLKMQNYNCRAQSN